MSIERIVSKLENNIILQKGDEERFNGYGVMGLTFTSGHILALRHFMASSIGPGYRSVWHRNPKGEWTFYADSQPSRSCTRYFGEQVHEAISEKIEITWTGDNRFQVEMQNIRFRWEVTLAPTPATNFMNLVAGIMPGSWWKNEGILRLTGKVAGKILQAGHVSLSGYAPNGQHFIANPYKIWLVSKSRASLGCLDLGELGPLSEQAHLQDFWIPQKGIFALGRAYFESFDKSKHSAHYSRSSHHPNNQSYVESHIS
jgi:hypothetical protein